MFKITQEQLNTKSNIQSLVLNSKGKLNYRYAKLIEDFENLKEPTSKLTPKADQNIKAWELPEIKQGPDRQFTLDTHVSIFGRSPAWNYLVLARDIMKLNGLNDLPNLATIKSLLKLKKVTASSCVSVAPVERTSEANLVKDHPIEFVLEVLFGNPNIQWKEAAALVKGLDSNLDSSIYKKFTIHHLPHPVQKDFVKSSMMLMPGEANYDRFVLFNELMQAKNEPVTEVPKDFKLSQFKEAQLEWVSKKSSMVLYSDHVYEYVKGVGDEPYLKKNTPRDVVCLLDQVTEAHTESSKGLYFIPKFEINPIYDDEDPRLIERIRTAPVGEEFLFNGMKDPIAYFIYTLITYEKRWNWKRILGYKK